MKKVLLLLLAGLMAFFGVSVNAMAGARLDSMGADVRQFDDQDVIWLYPNKALLYKDMVDLRLNNTYQASGYFSQSDSDYAEWGGVLKDAGDLGVIGAYLNRPNYLPGQYYTNQDYFSTYNARYWVDSPLFAQPFSPVGGAVRWNTAGANVGSYGSSNTVTNTGNGLATLAAGNNLTPQNLVDGFWAKSFSGLDLGVVINYGENQNYELNAGDDARSLGVNVAGGFGAVGPFNAFNAHIGYQMGSLSNPSNNVNDNGIYTIPFGVLGDLTLDTDNTLRVFVDGQMNQFSLKNITGPAYSEKNVNDHFLLGGAVNKKISGGKGLATLGLFYAYDDAESSNSANNNKADQADWSVIANIGVETPLSTWLTWRAGLTKMIFERWWDRAAGAGASNYGDFWVTNNQVTGYSGSGISSLNTGLSVAVENWTLDATVSLQGLEQFIGDPNLGALLFGDPNGQGASNAPPLEIVTFDAKYKI